MGLFDFFSGKKNSTPPGSARTISEREYLRLEKIVSTKLSQNIDRQEALEQLAAAADARSEIGRASCRERVYHPV